MKDLFDINKNTTIEDVEKFLKENPNINVNEFDRWGNTVLMYVLFHKCFPIVKLLLNHGANPFAKYHSAINCLDYINLHGTPEIKKYVNTHIKLQKIC